MSKVIKCDVEGFEGSITLPDILSLPQFMIFRKASIEAEKSNKDGDDFFEQMNVLLPGMLPMVEKWSIKGLPENVTIDDWPGTPPDNSINLFNWLLSTFVEVYLGKQKESDSPEA